MTFTQKLKGRAKIIMIFPVIIPWTILILILALILDISKVVFDKLESFTWYSAEKIDKILDWISGK